ncbi:hypothetical protein [uncultured Roseobacter sp.]|nr:hypothetical protein [uncultured Roseobacter sp.]
MRALIIAVPVPALRKVDQPGGDQASKALGFINQQMARSLAYCEWLA